MAKDKPQFIILPDRTGLFFLIDAIGAGLAPHKDFTPIRARTVAKDGKRTKEYADLAAVGLMETWVEVPISEDWIAAYRLLPQYGQPVIGEVRVFPAKPNRKIAGRWSAEILGGKAQVPPGGLTARLLRKVRLGESARSTRKFLEWFRKEHGDTWFQREQPLGRRGISPPSEKPSVHKRGRKGRPDIFYARIARDYAKARERGSTSPVTDIAKKWSLPRDKVRDMVHQARVRGFLEGGMPGRWYGQLTQQARMLLGKRKP